jgi:hypothetical protein
LLTTHAAREIGHHEGVAAHMVGAGQGSEHDDETGNDHDRFAVTARQRLTICEAAGIHTNVGAVVARQTEAECPVEAIAHRLTNDRADKVTNEMFRCCVVLA